MASCIILFIEIIKKEAMKSLESIAKTKLIDNIGPMRNNIEIAGYSTTNVFYRDKFKYNAAGGESLLNTKESQQFFLRLINDEILISELTKLYYDSLAKDENNNSRNGWS
jgi:hypothetical protein